MKNLLKGVLVKKAELMKKLFLLSLLFLTSCIRSSTTLTPTYDIRRDFTPTPLFTEILRTSAKCPQICWLGIHPGTTSEEEAIRIIKNSNQFEHDVNTPEISSDHIHAYWYRNKGHSGGTNVYLTLSEGLVK